MPLLVSDDDVRVQEPADAECGSGWSANSGERTIAGISSCDIAQMTCPELVRFVLSVGLPHLSQGVRDGLCHRDRETLERLAHQARLCCRNQRE
jgi:hypothetical protein